MSTIRFGGLISGMDTHGMVQQLMRAENMRMDRFTRRRQQATWRRDDLRNTATMLNEFRRTQTAMNTPNTLMNPSVWNTMRAEVTGETAAIQNGVRVTASGSAPPGHSNIVVNRSASGDQFRGDAVFRGSADPNAPTVQMTGASGTMNSFLTEELATPAPDGRRHTSAFFGQGDAEFDAAFTAWSIAAGNAADANAEFIAARDHFRTVEAARNEVIRNIDDDATRRNITNLTTREVNAREALNSAHFARERAREALDNSTYAADSDEHAALQSAYEAANTRFNDATEAHEAALEARDDALYDAGIAPDTFEAADNARDAGNVYANEYNRLAAIRNDALRDMNDVRVEATVNINGTAVTVRSNDTVNDFMGRVNSNANAGVTMNFDSVRGVFTLTAAGVGTGNNARSTVHTEGNASDSIGFAILDRMGLEGIAQRTVDANDPTGTRSTDSRAVAGRYARSAQIEVDGVLLHSNTGEFRNINGKNITVDTNFRTHDADGNQLAENLRTVNVEVRRDIEDAVERIRDFINAYNDLIRNLNGLHNTARPRHGSRTFYDPLTPAEREAMSDREVQMWEEKARTGLLHRDESIRRVHTQMREWMQAPVALRDANGVLTGQTMTLHQIGITTNYGDSMSAERLMGLMDIDEDRLRHMLQQDPDGVSQLFTTQLFVPVTNASQRTERLEHQGLAMRLNDIIDLANSSRYGHIHRRVGAEGGMDADNGDINRVIREYDARIAQLEGWLMRRESHFFRMFNRMEQAMAQSHQQMDSLWAFGGGM